MLCFKEIQTVQKKCTGCGLLGSWNVVLFYKVRPHISGSKLNELCIGLIRALDMGLLL